jgi:hypothetical protein
MYVLEVIEGRQDARGARRPQNPPGFGPWGFNSPSRHQYFLFVLNGLWVI